MTARTVMFASSLSLCCFTMSGCWDYKELEQQALLTGLGYDRNSKGDFMVIAYIDLIVETRPLDLLDLRPVSDFLVGFTPYAMSLPEGSTSHFVQASTVGQTVLPRCDQGLDVRYLADGVNAWHEKMGNRA